MKMFIDGPTCELLGPISLALQSFLGCIAVGSLALKRKYERPRRPLKVWVFDVSKQVIGALLLHFLNVLMSIFFSDDQPDMDDNPCVWYFLNVLFDTTIGVPLLWASLWWVYRIAYHFKLTEVMSGEYGNPPRTRAFLKQLSLYILALIAAKFLLYLVFWCVPELDDWGAWLISWTYFDARVQIVFVMLVFPTVMNAIQYLVVDSIIQSPEYGVAAEALPEDLRERVIRYHTFEDTPRSRARQRSGSKP